VGVEEVNGLKILQSLLPAQACLLVLSFMDLYKLHGEKLKKDKRTEI
jgi:hypothetical protein